MSQAQLHEKETGTEAEYLDLKKLSVYTSVAIPTLRERLREGKLPFYKLRGKILVRKSDFDEYMQSYRVDKREGLDELVDDVIEAMKS
jgi:excisionase family DNA binding protein